MPLVFHLLYNSGLDSRTGQGSDIVCEVASCGSFDQKSQSDTDADDFKALCGAWKSVRKKRLMP